MGKEGTLEIPALRGRLVPFFPETDPLGAKAFQLLDPEVSEGQSGCKPIPQTLTPLGVGTLVVWAREVPSSRAEGS